MVNLQFGLIGHPLGHSLSKEWMTARFGQMNLDATYTPVDLPTIDSFKEMITNRQWNGLNVTIPYKTAIIPYLDSLTPTAQAIGAVNTLIFTKNNGIIGDNTDAIGFQSTLTPHLKKHHPYQALILGTGGASYAVQYVLTQLNIDYTLVSRSNNTNEKQTTYNQLTPDIISQHHLIVNTTPLGMWPNQHTMPPIPYHGITPDHILYDLVYNPLDTQFLVQGRKYGANTIAGIDMLHAQADASLKKWLEANK